MRRLCDHQPVEVELDGESEVIECHVLTVRGSAAALHYADDLSSSALQKLSTGSLCFLVFSHEGTPVALRGVARAIADVPALEFVVIDGVQVRERRHDPRRSVIAEIRLIPLRDDERDVAAGTVETLTVDLSLGGALLARYGELGAGPLWEVELLAPDEERPIRCRARIAHETATHIGIAFEEMSDSDQIRLAGVLADHHRRLRTVV